MVLNGLVFRLKAQLMSAQQERDTSVKKTKRLEEELETIRVYYR